MKKEDCNTRTLRLGLLFFVITVGGCCTHLYTFEKNMVTIHLKKPEVQTAMFACSLDGYQGRLLKSHNGLFKVTLPADKPFRYFYVVDGEIFLPPCPLRENDDFGTENCIFQP